MILFSQPEFQKLKEVIVAYNCALKTMLARLEVLYTDYSSFHNYNPIEHIKSRLKSPESIADKLHRNGYEITAAAAGRYLQDIAGIRIICSFARDIYKVADDIRRQNDIAIVRERDYIKTPKPSGYRSYHMIVNIPIYFSEGARFVTVEIQIRTAAMDFWACLEHKAKYKYLGEVPENLALELRCCSDEINKLDSRMFVLHEKITNKLLS